MEFSQLREKRDVQRCSLDAKLGDEAMMCLLSGLSVKFRQSLVSSVFIEDIVHSGTQTNDGGGKIVFRNEAICLEEHQLLAKHRRFLLKRIAIRPNHIHALRVVALQVGAHHEPQPEVRTVGELGDQFLVAAAIALVIAHLDVERRQIDCHLQICRIIHRCELERLTGFRIVSTIDPSIHDYLQWR